MLTTKALQKVTNFSSAQLKEFLKYIELLKRFEIEVKIRDMYSDEEEGCIGFDAALSTNYSGPVEAEIWLTMDE